MTDEARPGADYRGLLALEARVQAFWEREKVPARVLALHPDGRPFRFTEGPPTANGRPHAGHLFGRALKDMALRHRRMTGHRIVTSMAGWDCHGLPVELEVEKSHGWKSKKQILEYGVAKFAAECRTSVMACEEVWKTFSRRLGFWLDYDNAYFTMAPDFVESVWWAVRQLHEKGLLEKGHRVVPYCPRCETPEATHEVAQGYRETTDPSVTVHLPLTGTPVGSVPADLLVWTTTPWTLPSNLAVAVSASMTYVRFAGEGGRELIMGEPAFARYFPDPAKRPAVLGQMTGKELVGRTYEPPFAGVTPGGPGRHLVYAAAFVTATEGTGLVHVAPSFGVDDYELGRAQKLGVFDPLDPSGRFTDKVPSVQGLFFKTADPKLIEELKGRGRLWRQEKFSHTYPFCWRCSTPLMYRALDSWFVSVHLLRDKLVAHNTTVNWLPEHLRDGRFGNFVAEGKDWALSRNRYWATPLPIWTCPRGCTKVMGSFEELARHSPRPLPQPFDPHRPTVDELELHCPEHKVVMVREPYVMDGWFDSGAAPFAQYHYPFNRSGPFDPSAPLDYIAEGLDQTRGWYYTLLVLSVALFDRPAARTILTNGLALDDQGQKMSKSKGNTMEPLALMDRFGADATRLGIYLGPYTDSFRFTETSIRLTGSRLLTTLLNVLEFHDQNAKLDALPPPTGTPKPSGALDRWLLSRLEDLVGVVDASLTGYDAHKAAQEVQAFVEDLSTWYLRRSRPRFWAESLTPDKKDAYATLRFSLAFLGRALAPLAPYMAEQLFQAGTGAEMAPGASSVHLEPFPRLTGCSDPALEAAMARVRTLVEGGRDLRMKAGVKSRIPLEELVVSGVPPEDRAALGPAFAELLGDELNVKQVTALDPAGFAARAFPETEWVTRSVEGGLSVALSRTPSHALLLEGLAREVIRRVQIARKEARLDFAAKIELTLWVSPGLDEACRAHGERIARECQAVDLTLKAGEPEGGRAGVHRWDDVAGEALSLALSPVPG